MKLIINYDFIKEVYNAREEFSISKSCRNTLPKHIDIVFLSLTLCTILGFDANTTIAQTAGGYALISSMGVITDCLLYKICGDDVYERESSKKLKKLVPKLENLNVRTDYQSLLESELYAKHYKIDINNGILPKLVEEKYVLVPGRFFRGDKEDISVLQEHVVGSEKYVLSLGSPSKKKSLKLVNSFS